MRAPLGTLPQRSNKCSDNLKSHVSDISVLEKLWREGCCEFQAGLA